MELVFYSPKLDEFFILKGTENQKLMWSHSIESATVKDPNLQHRIYTAEKDPAFVYDFIYIGAV